MPWSGTVCARRSPTSTRDRLTLSPSSVEQAIGVHTSAILATHIYGTPCDVEGLHDVAERNGLKLFFDAAHAFGSTHGGAKVGGFGEAEVFSFSPTKVVVAAEGGLIATNDDLLAERCRIGRNYGNPGDYDCRFVGLNARMSELHAATALASLSDLDERLEERNRLAGRLHDGPRGVIPGIRVPEVPAGDRSTYKDYTILVEPEECGLDADALARRLADSTGSRPVATTHHPCTPCTPTRRSVGRPDHGRSPIGPPSRRSPCRSGWG